MTRKHLAEHIDSPMFKDLIENTLIRFSIQNEKYVNGFIKDVEESTASAKKPYMVSYQKFIRTDPSTKKPVMKNIQVKSTKMLIIQLGNSGIFTKPRRVQISHVSNGPPTEKEFQELVANFK